MTTVEEIRITRSLYIEKLKAAYKKMGDNIKSQRSRLVDKYYEEVKNFFAEFERAHIQYALKSKLELDDESMLEVSNTANEFLDLAEKMYDNFSEQLATRETVNNKESKKAEEKKMRSKFTAELDELLKHIQDYLDKVDEEVNVNTEALSGEITFLESKYKNIMEIYDTILDGTEEMEVAEVVRKKAQAERKYREGLFTLRAYVSDKTPQNSQPSSRRSSPERESFRHKKIDFPKFGGSL